MGCARAVFIAVGILNIVLAMLVYGAGHGFYASTSLQVLSGYDDLKARGVITENPAAVEAIQQEGGSVHRMLAGFEQTTWKTFTIIAAVFALQGGLLVVAGLLVNRRKSAVAHELSMLGDAAK